MKSALCALVEMAKDDKFQQCVEKAAKRVKNLESNNQSESLYDIKQSLGIELQESVEPIAHRLTFYNNILSRGAHQIDLKKFNNIITHDKSSNVQQQEEVETDSEISNAQFTFVTLHQTF